MNVAVAVRLLDQVTVGSDSQLATLIGDRRNHILLHHEHLLRRHTEVLVFAQVANCSACERWYGETDRGSCPTS